MTPGRVVSKTLQRRRNKRRTKRMPKDEGQLGHLLPLFAEFQQGAFSGLGPHHLGNPLQNPPVLVGHGRLAVGHDHGAPVLALLL